MKTMTVREALNEAMIEEMERDENVFLMGEEVEPLRKYIEDHALDVKNLDV